MKEIIICSAIYIPSTGKVYKGHRHNHCRDAANGQLSWYLNRQQIIELEQIEGFVTSTNRFVDRKEAAIIWLAENEQNKLSHSTTELYSEDLY